MQPTKGALKTRESCGAGRPAPSLAPLGLGDAAGFLAVLAPAAVAGPEVRRAQWALLKKGNASVMDPDWQLASWLYCSTTGGSSWSKTTNGLSDWSSSLNHRYVQRQGARATRTPRFLKKKRRPRRGSRSRIRFPKTNRFNWASGNARRAPSSRPLPATHTRSSPRARLGRHIAGETSVDSESGSTGRARERPRNGRGAR
jgi:hypothetical protein